MCNWNTHTLLVELWNAAATLKKSGSFSSGWLNIMLPYDLTIPLLGMYSKDFKTYVQTKTCTHMFILGFFIIARK